MSNYIDVDEITKDVETLSKAFTINVYMPSGGKSVACNIKPTSEQDIAIKYCHDHKLLMIPVDSNSERAEVQAYFDGEAYGWEQGRKALIEDVKTEIDEQYDRVKPYNIDVAQGLEMAFDILDNIGKAESEE